MTAVLRSDAGVTITLEVGRWRDEPDRFEWSLLDRLADPVLDVGCGPGRVAAALASRGRPTLGIDPSLAAVAEAVGRGAPVLCRSVFDPLPGEGRWGGLTLLDGNIGIGGDPATLLRRVAGLLRRGGTAVVEVESPGTRTESMMVQLETGQSAGGPWFPWARVGTDSIAVTAAASGLALQELESGNERWIAWLVKR